MDIVVRRIVCTSNRYIAFTQLLLLYTSHRNSGIGGSREERNGYHGNAYTPVREEYAGRGVLYIPSGSIEGWRRTIVDVRGSRPTISADVSFDFSFLFQDAHWP